MAKGVPETHPEERQALNWSPKKNWVEKAGGLPSYINSVAVALVRGGMPRERAIPTAVNVVKKTCATGLWGGRPNAKVSPAIRAAACKAAAEWEAKKGGAKLSACADCGAVDLAGPVVTSKAGGSYTTNALLKPPSGLKPRHVRALANLAKAGMPKGKRRRVLASMAKGLRSGKVSLSVPLAGSRTVDLAFNPSEQRAPKGAAGGGRWAAGGAEKQQQSQPLNRHDRALAWRARHASNPRARKQAARALARIAKRRTADAKREAKRRAREKQQQHDALAAVNAQRRGNRGIGTNPHMRALALRSKTASNSKARVQAARALTKIIRQHGAEKKRAQRATARAATRQSSTASRARAVAAARAAKQATPKRATTRPAKTQTRVPKPTRTPRRLVSKL